MTNTKKPPKPKVQKDLSHYKDPLPDIPGRIGGYGRKAGAASVEVKNIVIAEIRRAAQKHGLTKKDIANLIAIAKVESGFNPDAAARGKETSASGVFQITDKTANDAIVRVAKKPWGLGIKLGSYERFDYQSNIQYGIVVYLDKKQRAKSEDVGDIYKQYNSEEKEYAKYLGTLREDSAKYLEALEKGIPITVSEIDFPYPIVVLQENKTGRNEVFQDTLSGHTMTREEFVQQIQAGKYPHYTVAVIHGTPTPISKPDKIKENNLG